jgi:nitroimidazol reductase NimA-like FMN-containing flavoprotein (pyridoxamine 5'-phosphate oxidase superfamily)
MADVPDELAERLTADPLTAHLATCRDGRPHVAPVWYLYDDGVVRIVTTGRKLADIRANPYVSLSIEKSERGLPEWTATLRGTATAVEDSDAFERANARINRKYGVGDDAWEENTLVRIDIGSSSYRSY